MNLLVAALACSIAGAEPIFEKRENFDRDPGWENFTTRQKPADWPQVKQDFGWRNGEIGGLISRSTEPASYALAIKDKTLEQPLKASGKFRVRKNYGNSGVLFGWFNETSRGWRTPNSLVFRLDGNGGGFWVFSEYGTRNGLTAGKGCFEGDRYQTTTTKPFPADGAAHSWTLEYDPHGMEERGLITFTLDGRAWTLPLETGHKMDGASFNRFGILNQHLFGDGMEAFFSDLNVGGEALDLVRDPNWEARGAHAEFAAPIVRPFNDAKWQSTAQAGGKPGEFGGIFWRDDPPAFWATPVGRITLDDELFASGRIVMKSAGADSGVYLGWFNAASKTNRAASDRTITQTNALAIAIEGPSRIGHYFRAAAWDSSGHGVFQESGPVLAADSISRSWSLRYSPAAANGRGQITVTLDSNSTAIELPAEMRRNGAAFDHFGFLNFQPDGHYVQVFVDDLQHSTRRP